MNLKRLTRTFMLESAGINPCRSPVAGGGADKWIPVMILPSSNQGAKSHLVTSIAENVDDNKKRGSFLQMVDALFRAITQDDLRLFFDNSIVEYKTAHKFKYKNKYESLRELKQGKKDRIYIFPHDGKCGKYIFVLEVLHKNQQNTPDSIKNYAEDTIKEILEARFMALVN